MQHNVVNARMWQPKGKKGTLVVKTNTGRKRINIIGGLNLKDMIVTTTLTEEKCNKYRIVDFLMVYKL